jgi:hypothetical protein
MDAGFFPLVMIAILAFAVAVAAWHYSRARNVLEDWAEANSYEILSSEHRWFRRGPFWWRTGKGQEVYYVTVRTLDRQIKRGWVRCGNLFLGLFVSEADVRWDE